MADFLPRVKILGRGPQSKLALASALIEQGNAPQAISECRAALKLNPCYATAYMVLAGVYADLGQYQEAIEVAGKALDNDPKLIGVLKRSLQNG